MQSSGEMTYFPLVQTTSGRGDTALMERIRSAPIHGARASLHEWVLLFFDQVSKVGCLAAEEDLRFCTFLGICILVAKLGMLCFPSGQAGLFFGLQKADQFPAQFGQVAALSEEEAKIHENGVFQAADDQTLIAQRAASSCLTDNAHVVAKSYKAGHAENLGVVQHHIHGQVQALKGIAHDLIDLGLGIHHHQFFLR